MLDLGLQVPDGRLDIAIYGRIWAYSSRPGPPGSRWPLRRSPRPPPRVNPRVNINTLSPVKTNTLRTAWRAPVVQSIGGGRAGWGGGIHGRVAGCLRYTYIWAYRSGPAPRL